MLIFLLTALIWSNACHTSSVVKEKPMEDSIRTSRSKYVAWLNEYVRGREQVIVDSIFVNLKYIGGFEASIFPVVMEKWSIALGVSCDHCHIPGEWESDVKPQKNIARQMAALSSTINQKLNEIEEFKDRKPVINCATCHRGQLKPARSVPVIVNPSSHERFP